LRAPTTGVVRAVTPAFGAHRGWASEQVRVARSPSLRRHAAADDCPAGFQIATARPGHVQSTAVEVAKNEKTHKDTDNFFVTVGRQNQNVAF
jgi:hypothetical protein